MSVFDKKDALRRSGPHTEELLYHVAIEMDLMPPVTRLRDLCDKETIGDANQQVDIQRGCGRRSFQIRLNVTRLAASAYNILRRPFERAFPYCCSLRSPEVGEMR